MNFRFVALLGEKTMQDVMSMVWRDDETRSRYLRFMRLSGHEVSEGQSPGCKAITLITLIKPGLVTYTSGGGRTSDSALGVTFTLFWEACRVR